MLTIRIPRLPSLRFSAGADEITMTTTDPVALRDTLAVALGEVEEALNTEGRNESESVADEQPDE